MVAELASCAKLHDVSGVFELIDKRSNGCERFDPTIFKSHEGRKFFIIEIVDDFLKH